VAEEVETPHPAYREHGYKLSRGFERPGEGRYIVPYADKYAIDVKGDSSTIQNRRERNRTAQSEGEKLDLHKKEKGKIEILTQP